MVSSGTCSWRRPTILYFLYLHGLSHPVSFDRSLMSWCSRLTLTRSRILRAGYHTLLEATLVNLNPKILNCISKRIVKKKFPRAVKFWYKIGSGGLSLILKVNWNLWLFFYSTTYIHHMGGRKSKTLINVWLVQYSMLVDYRWLKWALYVLT